MGGRGGNGFSVCLGGFDLTALLLAHGHEKEKDPTSGVRRYKRKQ